MTRQKGFSLIELMISMAIILVVAGSAVGALLQAERVMQGVALEANTQENLRAGMHFLVKDVTQAGEGLPPTGISIPNSTAQASALNWPGLGTTFNTNYVALNGIVTGHSKGQLQKGITNKGAVITANAVNSDAITVLYADNILQDAAGNYLNSFPVVSAGCPTGALSAASVTVDPGCFALPGAGAQPLAVGNLIMFQNQFGTALEYVTAVNGSVISFAGSDGAGHNEPSGLNAPPASMTNGTVAALLANGAAPTTITRIWMVTFYLDSTTNSTHPQLVRQVNYPGYPTVAAQVNPPQPIADDVEALNFTYDIINSGAPSGTYPNGAGDAAEPASWAAPTAGADTAQQIRAVNAYLAGRSETAFQLGTGNNYFHNNLSTQICIRSMDFTNNFNISSTAVQ